MQTTNNTLIAFTGLMYAGKDHVAKACQLPIIGFADPLYELAEHFYGTRDKAIVRGFMQEIGQWGWGRFDNNKYQGTAARAQFLHLIRTEGYRMTKNFTWVDWSEFGKRQDFWVNILLMTLGLRPMPGRKNVAHQTELFAEYQRTLQYIITNIRFGHELNPAIECGFSHYHVMCSEETRRERMKAAGANPTEVELHDISEQLAWKLNLDMDDDHTIWNDHRDMPIGRNMLTVEQFVAKHGQPRKVATATDNVQVFSPSCVIAPSCTITA